MNLEFRMIVKECTWLAVSWLSIQAMSDIVIAMCMCLLLRRRRTGFQKTDSMINRMILYAISTGLVTSVFSCFILVTFVKYGFHHSELTVGIPLGGFYSITMLTNLHSRKTLQARLDTPTPLELSYSMKNRMPQNIGNRQNAERLHTTRVNITIEVASDEVDIKAMDNDLKVQFSAVQDPILGGGPDPEPEAMVSSMNEQF